MEEVKRAEILAAEKLRHRVVLSHYIRTAAGPPLQWLPAAPSPATDALLAREKDRLDIWKVLPSRTVMVAASCDLASSRFHELDC